MIPQLLHALPSLPIRASHLKPRRIPLTMRVWLALVLAFVQIGYLAPSPSSTASAQPLPAAAAASTPSFHSFIIHLARPTWVIAANAPGDKLDAEVRKREINQLRSTLEALAKSGEVGNFSVGTDQNSFRADLSQTARATLATNPLVASIESAPTAVAPATPSASSQSSLPGQITTQDVSSIAYIQVYSPFMWGHVSVGGLSVQLTLEDSNGTTIGVPCQTYRPAPGNNVQIDRTQLYFETVFVDPQSANASTCSPAVMIMPNDRVHIVTSGVDPSTGVNVVNDRTITVDDVRAWTSYQNDTVSGTAPPGSTVIVTVGPLSLANYLAPTTYNQVTADPSSGAFTVSSFCTGTSTTCNSSVPLQQGSTGFVRVRYSSGDEVYTVHGQNVLALENSPIVRGYAFSLPTAPPSLDSGVTVYRPAPILGITLKNSSGQVVASATTGNAPYTATFPTPLTAGDELDVSINNGPTNQISLAPLSANVDLTNNQVTGTGPANTQLLLAAGRIDGFITQSSSWSFIQQNVTTSSSGSFASGQIQCGTSNLLKLQPGSFGYVGYEDSHANFVYLSYAAPIVDVMANYPFLEGWVANGTVVPNVTVRGADGSIKYQGAAPAVPLFIVSAGLYTNTYFNLFTSQFIVPGDTVTVSEGDRTFTIPVDNFSANINTDDDFVSGIAPAGATLRVIPTKDRTAFAQVTADGSGSYATGSSFTTVTDSNCNQGTKTENFVPGDGGRVYLTHPDGSRVFEGFGRSISVNENENFVELYLYATQGVDWQNTPQVPVQVTITPSDGTSTTVAAKGGGPGNGDTKVYLVDSSQQKIIIRAGDSISATFSEGPSGTTRDASISVNSIPLITGSPDLDSNTLAGVGPQSWWGQALLNAPPYTNPIPIAPRAYTAFQSLHFNLTNGSPSSLAQGYSGTVSFTDGSSNRIWVAWAVTTIPVKITSLLRPGSTQVCGTAAPNTSVTIYDATDEANDLNSPLGTSSSDSSGNFCDSLSSPLHAGQVILADADGTFSQPAVIQNPIFIPFVIKN